MRRGYACTSVLACIPIEMIHVLCCPLIECKALFLDFLGTDFVGRNRIDSLLPTTFVRGQTVRIDLLVGVDNVTTIDRRFSWMLPCFQYVQYPLLEHMSMLSRLTAITDTP